MKFLGLIKAVWLALIAFGGAPALAHDSAWLLCKGPVTPNSDSFNPVISILERRDGPEKRKTEVTLVYGAHVLVGSYDDSISSSSAVTLKGSSDNQSYFDGHIDIDYVHHKLHLNGLYSLSGIEKGSSDLYLPCEERN